MKRVVTALLAAAVAVPAVALLPSRIFFWVCLALFWGIAVEFEKLGRKLSPGVSGWIFLGVFPVVGASWAFGGDDHSLSLVALVAAPLIYAVGAFRAADDPRGAAIGLGWWSFGTPLPGPSRVVDDGAARRRSWSAARFTHQRVAKTMPRPTMRAPASAATSWRPV